MKTVKTFTLFQHALFPLLLMIVGCGTQTKLAPHTKLERFPSENIVLVKIPTAYVDGLTAARDAATLQYTMNEMKKFDQTGEPNEVSRALTVRGRVRFSEISNQLRILKAVISNICFYEVQIEEEELFAAIPGCVQ